MLDQLKISNRPSWESNAIKRYKAKVGKRIYYGDDWVIFSITLRKEYKKCQWCDKYFRRSMLQCHHIGRLKYNPNHLLDRRVVMVVCDDCHFKLEPYAQCNLTQMLPQLYES